MTNQTGKTCTKCREWKPFDSYGRNPTSADDRHSRCRDCSRAQSPTTEAERQAEIDRRPLPSVKVDFKRCTKCKRTRSIEDFHYSPLTRDGHVSRCKACERERYQQQKRRNLARRRAEQGAAIAEANTPIGQA